MDTSCGYLAMTACKSSIPAPANSWHCQPASSLGHCHTNHLWIATKKDGIYVYDLENKQIKKIPKVYQNRNDDKKNIITNLYVDARNYIWLADAENVAKCKYENGELRVVDSYPIFMPMEFAQDKQGNMWVSTAGVDIYLISHQDGTMTKKQLFPSTFTFIPSIICLNNGNLLVSAFYKPILEIDGKTKVIREFKVNPTDWKKCIKRSVYIPTKTLQDSKGNIWFGTVTNGLLKYDANTHRMQPIPGLSCSDISSIEEDKNGNLWVSTMYGLNKLDIKAHKITSYKEADGIGGFQFYDRASCKLKDGTLIFGGTHGLTIFNPQNVMNNQSASTINWGTGIGLYYARSLALLHHGKLFANNRKDCQGAVFTLALPTHEEIYSDAEKRNLEEEQKMELSAKKDSMIANKIEQEDGSDNRPKVLIVDDDTEVVHYLRTLLATDYHVIYRFDAESALKAIREEEPSLILSDVVMPGISGYELCKAIKQELANSELDVNKATELMHISRTKLYYKVKGLTGENPSVFFKTYKLNRAAALIVEGKYNISEIAYMTGFNTLSHFSTSFKKQFGCTPSEYSKKTY